MMIGTVSGRRAMVRVPMRPPGNQDLEVEFLLDTGFGGFLAMPLPEVLGLSLPFIRRLPANLADGSQTRVSIYALHIEWNGEPRRVEVLATGKRPLLGTALLDGSIVTIDFIDGGMVTIETR
jgi:clan AA aspartic protease